MRVRDQKCEKNDGLGSSILVLQELEPSPNDDLHQLFRPSGQIRHQFKEQNERLLPNVIACCFAEACRSRPTLDRPLGTPTPPSRSEDLVGQEECSKILLKGEMHERELIRSARKQQSATTADVVHEEASFGVSILNEARMTHRLRDPLSQLIATNEDLSAVAVFCTTPLHPESDQRQPPFLLAERIVEAVHSSIGVDRLKIRLRNLVVEQCPPMGKACSNPMNQGHHGEQIGYSRQSQSARIRPHRLEKSSRAASGDCRLCFALPIPVFREALDLMITKGSNVPDAGFYSIIDKERDCVLPFVKRHFVVPHDSRSQQPSTGVPSHPLMHRVTQGLTGVNVGDLVQSIEKHERLTTR